MAFQDDQVKLKAGRISFDERAQILYRLGLIAQAKYDEFVVEGGLKRGYHLQSLQGSLQFDLDVTAFDNDYYLEGDTQERTEVANYFEFGTGIHNQNRAGKWRAGYIKPVSAGLKFMKFEGTNKFAGKTVFAKKVEGVYPIFAMQKAIKYVEFHRKSLQHQIRGDLQ